MGRTMKDLGGQKIMDKDGTYRSNDDANRKTAFKAQNKNADISK